MTDNRERLVGGSASAPRALARMRRAVYQVHLWTGLVLGLYLVMLSLTGSALVYRLELNRLFQAPAPTFDPDRVPMASDALAEAARRPIPATTRLRSEPASAATDPSSRSASCAVTTTWTVCSIPTRARTSATRCRRSCGR